MVGVLDSRDNFVVALVVLTPRFGVVDADHSLLPVLVDCIVNNLVAVQSEISHLLGLVVLFLIKGLNHVLVV